MRLPADFIGLWPYSFVDPEPRERGFVQPKDAFDELGDPTELGEAGEGA